MKAFSGFPAGKQAVAKVPNTFFAELLPAIDDLAELKVTLYCLWLLNHKQGDLRYTRVAEIAADESFYGRAERHSRCAGQHAAPGAGTG